MTNVARAMELVRIIKRTELEVEGYKRDLREIQQQMGHPSMEQIERAAEMGKEIRRGCTENP